MNKTESRYHSLHHHGISKRCISGRRNGILGGKHGSCHLICLFTFFFFFFGSQQELIASDCFCPSSSVPLAHSFFTFKGLCKCRFSREASIQLPTLASPLPTLFLSMGFVIPRGGTVVCPVSASGQWSIKFTTSGTLFGPLLSPTTQIGA